MKGPMITIEIPANKVWDEKAEMIFDVPATKLVLCHSLISISKWEAQYRKRFLKLNKFDEKNGINTPDELLNYVKCMTVNNNINPYVYNCLTDEDIKKIQEYISAEMTGTTFNTPDSDEPKPNREAMSSEMMYYYMSAAQIPFSCEEWHLSRLIALLRIASIKNDPNPKKQTNAQITKSNAAINAARRAKYHTKG